MHRAWVFGEGVVYPLCHGAVAFCLIAGLRRYRSGHCAGAISVLIPEPADQSAAFHFCSPAHVFPHPGQAGVAQVFLELFERFALTQDFRVSEQFSEPEALPLP